MASMNFPDNLRYTEDHEWVRLEEGGQIATVGVTEFAQSELGDVVFVELEPIGTELAAEEPFGTIEAVKTVSELFMPLSGKIESHNADLETSPESVNDDPYGDGWMIRIELTKPSEVERLLTAETYRDLVAAN